MKCVSVLAILFGFLIGASMGCGSTTAPVASGSDGDAPKKSGEPSKAADKDDVPKDKPYLKPEDLLAGMPKEAYPLVGDDKGIERDAARKWCEKNIVGLTLEWTDTVKILEVTGTGSFEVRFVTDTPLAFGTLDTGARDGRQFGGRFPLGSEQCVVIVNSPTSHASLGSGMENRANYLCYRYSGCTAEEAKALRALEGKVTFRARVTEANVGRQKEANVIILTVQMPSINGLLPKVLVPKDKK